MEVKEAFVKEHSYSIYLSLFVAKLQYCITIIVTGLVTSRETSLFRIYHPTSDPSSIFLLHYHFKRYSIKVSMVNMKSWPLPLNVCPVKRKLCKHTELGLPVVNPAVFVVVVVVVEIGKKCLSLWSEIEYLTLHETCVCFKKNQKSLFWKKFKREK